MHVYRDDVLVKTVTAEEAKSLTIPAQGAVATDVQIVMVTKTGEVLASADPSPSPATKSEVAATAAQKAKAKAKAKAAAGKAALRSANDKTKN